MDDGTADFTSVPDLSPALVEYALGNWCVPALGCPDTDPTTPMDRPWTKPEVRFEISDFSMRALYQLHYLWAREDGRTLHDGAWASYYATTLLRGGLIPVVGVIGGLPVGCAEVTLFTDPFSGKLCGHADHAYVLPTFRMGGVFDLIMKGCVNAARYLGVTRAIIPAAPHLVEMYERQAAKEGWTSERLCTILTLEPS